MPAGHSKQHGLGSTADHSTATRAQVNALVSDTDLADAYATVATKTGNYTTTDADDYLELNGNFTLTLHTATNNQKLHVVNIGGTQTIANLSDLDTLYLNESLSLYYNGSAWRVV